MVDETITHSRLIAKHLMAETPGRYRYVQGGLGQGLGVALGVKLALGPDRLVAFTVGDGSWLYNPVLPGLMASAQYGLPVLIVVFNNGKYLSMRHNHRRVYPDSVAARTGYQLGVDLSAQPDVAAVAAAAGAARLHRVRRQGARPGPRRGDRRRPRRPDRRRQRQPDPLSAHGYGPAAAIRAARVPATIERSESRDGCHVH